jgi:hypothetical protein
MHMSMELGDAYYLENLWGAKTPGVQEELIGFWLRTGALPARAEAERRVAQAFFVAQTKADQQLVAISSVYVQTNQQVGHPFYYFRCFVEERHRRASLARHLLMAARQELNARFIAGENPQIIGMVLEVQNEALQQFRTEAVWLRTGFVYIGRNQRGDHVRVSYFDGARIA